MKNSKLLGKDLILTGALAALMFVISFAIAVMGKTW
jgi:hypothetical protein